MVIMNVCGASGSGKTQFARLMQKMLNARRLSAYIIGLDCYYYDHSELSFAERAALNYDSPAAFDFDALYDDVSALLERTPINKREYDYANHLAVINEQMIFAPKVLIIEGIHVFADERIMDVADMNVYIDVDPDICLLRRINRDVNKRGRQLEDISEQYMTTVRPMFEKHIRGYKYLSDICVSGGGKNIVAAEVLCARVAELARANQRQH